MEYAAAVARRAAQVEAARRLAAARLAAAGDKMREAAWRRLDKTVRPGDRVRVSLLVLPHVRRLLKSQLVGDPLPLYSTSVFRVVQAQLDGRLGRTRYDLACASCDGGADPLPSLINGCLAQLPAELYGVERRYLLRVEAGTRATMGRALPHVLPRVW
jgi:hypothetical protein